MFFREYVSIKIFISIDEDFSRNVYLETSVFLVSSICVIYMLCGCGSELVFIYTLAREFENFLTYEWDRDYYWIFAVLR